jgi:ring-1,2-phenylacetyl-CoA epoxidase subunit PaaD
MVTEKNIRGVLRTINDPEMPINIIDLGIVEAVRIEDGDKTARVTVDLLPTFVGCPALPVIEEEVRKRISALPGVGEVAVRFLFAPPWTVDRISPAGREALRKFGITVPAASEQPVCPLCGSATVHLESPFGPTRCRMIYYCESCRNSFEHLKRLSLA